RAADLRDARLGVPHRRLAPALSCALARLIPGSPLPERLARRGRARRRRNAVRARPRRQVLADAAAPRPPVRALGVGPTAAARARGSPDQRRPDRDALWRGERLRDESTLAGRLRLRHAPPLSAKADPDRANGSLLISA